jgi:membrane protease YdiL (CAAX protease family)
MQGEAWRAFLLALPVALSLGGMGLLGLWWLTRPERVHDPALWHSKVQPLPMPVTALGWSLIAFAGVIVLTLPVIQFFPNVAYLQPSLIMLCVPVTACLVARLGPVGALGLRRLRWPLAVGLPLLALLAFVPAYFLSGALVRWVNDALHLNGEAQQVVDDFLGMKGWDRVGIIVLGSVVAPFCEELCFRGFLYPWLKNWLPRSLAVLATAMIFSALHGSWTAALPLLLLAWLLTELYEVSGSLWPSILLHCLFNSTTFVLLSYFPQLAEP